MERMKKAGITTKGRIDCYVDRLRGWAALEEAILDARQAVRMAAAGLDFETPLTSLRARRIGRNWQDLIRHTLGRGVAFAMTLDDPGPWSGPEGRSPLQDALMQVSQPLNAPQTGRRWAELSLTALGHPSLHRRCTAWCPSAQNRMTMGLIDDRVMFLSRRGLTDTHAGERDLVMLAHGPVVTEGATFLDEYADICSGLREPSPARRLLRSCACPARGMGRLLGLQTVANEVESAHHMLIRRAERLIYIETQRFDSPALAQHLVQRAAVVAALNLVLILPAGAPDRHTERCLRLLRAGFGQRLFVARAAGGCTNISVFDDETALAGSVDLSLQGLRRDTGLSLYLRRVDGVADLRQQLAQNWMADLTPECGAAEWRAALSRVEAPALALVS
jgi:phospholipase D1/2